MFTICMQLSAQGKIDEDIRSCRDSERHFTREAGVLERDYYQCVDQPHLIWANTRWTSEDAHNRLAKTMMKVRDDDRVASAYFRPGLYLEIFADELEAAAWRNGSKGPAEYLIIAHGVVSDRDAGSWPTALAERVRRFTAPAGLIGFRTFVNSYCTREFVSFLSWKDAAAYAGDRMQGDRTIEELLLVGDEPYSLAGYVQYECRPLRFSAA